MNRSLLLLLILIAAVALPADGRAQDERKVSQKIAAAGEDAQREWFAELGSFKTDLAFNLLKARCDDLLQKSRLYHVAYRGFVPFRGEGKLEQKALKYLKKSALSGLNQQATAAVIVLSQWGPSSHPFLQEIVFKAEEKRLRAYAIGPLLPEFCRSKDSKRLEILLQNYKIPASGGIEKFAASLEAVPQKRLLERMESWLQTRVPPALLEGAIQALQSIPGPEVQPILVKALRSEDAGVVFAALLELRRRGAQGYSKQLFPLLKSKDTTLRYFALIEKGRMMVGEPKWESFVEQMSESYDRVDRQASATIASHLPASQAWPYLDKLLADDERSVRIQALVSVGALRLPQAVPVLIQRMIAEQTAGNLVMRDRIVDVMADLTGQTFGPASHTWQLWWDNEKDNFVFPTAEEILAKAKEREARLEENSTVGSFYGLPVVSNRAVFIVDLSGSMNTAAKTNRYTGEKKATRLDVAKAQLTLALKNYADGGLFNMIFFHSGVRPWEKELVKMTEKTRAEAIEYVAKQRIGGATAIFNSLEAAFKIEGLDTIYLLTDGQPSGGTINNPKRIRELVNQWNAVSHITIHCVSIGGDNGLLRGLAKDSGGLMQVVN